MLNYLTAHTSDANGLPVEYTYKILYEQANGDLVIARWVPGLITLRPGRISARHVDRQTGLIDDPAHITWPPLR